MLADNNTVTIKNVFTFDLEHWYCSYNPRIEAIVSGKPLVCTGLNTGTTFINENGIAGLVIPPRDSKALAEAINNLVNNVSLRNELGENARRRALNEFTAEKMVERTLNVYRDLLK